MCIQQVRNKINNFSQKNFSSEPQITALLFVTVTQLDLDGPLPVTRVKWYYFVQNKTPLNNPFLVLDAKLFSKIHLQLAKTPTVLPSKKQG